jgi:hypothetical protein
MNTYSADDEPVGYGRPPKHSQWKKGQSGNPDGRRKGTRNVSAIVSAAAAERVTVTIHGQRRTLTKFEAAAMQLANQAASGELKAIKQMVDLLMLAETRTEAENIGALTPAQRNASDAGHMAALRKTILNIKPEEDTNNEDA